MKLAFAIIAVATAALVVIFFMVPPDDEPAPDLLRSKAAQDGPARSKPTKASLVDLATMRGEQVYMPRQETVEIDGRKHTYPSALVWCGSFAPSEGNRTTFKDIRIITNKEPKTADELSRMSTVSSEQGLDRIGDEINRLLEKGASGIRAGTAIFIGGRDLESAKQIDLSDDVHVYVAERAGKLRSAVIRSPTLVLTLDKGRITRATTKDQAHLVAAQADLEGTGFDADPKSGAIFIEKDIKGTIKDLALFGESGEPIQVTAGGPLRREPAFDAKATDATSKAGKAGTLIVEGGVVMTQGTSSVRGDTLTAVFAGDPAKLVSFVLDGRVEAELPEGQFVGARAEYAAPPEGMASLTLRGPGLRVQWRRGLRMIPGAPRDGDLEITSDGTAVYAGFNLKDATPRTLVIGPGVVLSGTETRIAGERLEVTFARIPLNKEGAAPGALTSVPSRIELSKGASGTTPEIAFQAETFLFSRKFHETGLPAEDRVLLTGTPWIERRLNARTSGGAAGNDSGRGLKALFGGDGLLRIEARDSIVAVRDPLKPKALDAKARGAVIVRRLGSEGSEDVRARLSAEAVDLDMDETFEAEATGFTRRLASRLNMKRVLATGNVSFVLQNRFEGRAETLDLDGTDDVADLKGGDGTGAMLAVLDDQGGRQQLMASHLRYIGATSTLFGEVGVTADILLAPFDLSGGGQGNPVATTIKAALMTVHLAEIETDKGRKRRVRDASASGGVVATQASGSVVRGTELRLDPEGRQGRLKGSPARIELVRNDDGVERREHIESPELLLLDDKALISGPMQARLFAEPQTVGARMGRPESKTPSVADGPKSMLPVDISGTGDALMDQDTILISGPATMRQGDPATDGFDLNCAAKLILFRAPAAETATDDGEPAKKKKNGLDIMKAVAEGGVRYLSPEIEGEGDVMEFDRAKKRVILYANQGSALLTHKGLGLLRFPRPSHVLHFSRPDQPPFYESLDKPIGR